MISLEQLNGEISALEEEKPTYAIMQKLADLYVVRDHMILEPQPGAAVVVSETLPDIESGTEFCKLVSGKDARAVLPVLDELMTTLQILNRKLYGSVLEK